MELLHRWLVHRRYAILLASLLLVVVGYPFFSEMPVGPGLLRAFWLVLVVAGVFSVGRSAGRLRAALVLGVLALVPRLLEPVVAARWPWATEGLGALLLGFVTWVVLRDVLSHQRVTSETLNGALCVYLLAGLIFSQVYTVLEATDPGSFRLPESAAHGAGLQEALTYFSMVTQTTLGYGDVVPASPAARSLAVGQAVFGQLYLAVLIARLVALEIAHRRNPPGGA